MASRPENPLAGRALTEILKMRKRIREEGRFDRRLVYFLGQRIVFKAAGQHATGVEGQAEPGHDRPELIGPVVIGNNENVPCQSALQKAAVAAQDMALIVKSQLQQAAIRDGCEKQGIISGHPQVTGQFAEIVIADELWICLFRIGISHRQHGADRLNYYGLWW